MKYDIELYINDKKVEFSADPKILMNYKETELHNPTIVRNSFTKQIQIQGTNTNNDIFQHIWNLDRYQVGLEFNPIKKTDFKLFVNGELFEKGYVKLDKVEMSNNQMVYFITLYGGLGQFFYNLTYEDDGTNNKKNLASLQYTTEWTYEPDLNFTANKETVYDAWGKICGWGTGDPKWDVINFAPCYNGIPQDFSADKVLINNKGISNIFYRAWTEDGTTYGPMLNGTQNTSGYSLGTFSEPMTEWQTFDLRSYKQRPVLRMMNLIEACCQPENNGGYQVKLDNHFFHVWNPYYYDAWMTLPMLTDLDGVGGGETTTVTGATITRQGSTNMYNVEFEGGMGAINNINLDLSIRFNPESATSATNLYTARNYKSNTNFTLQGSTFVKEYHRTGGVTVQLLAYSSSGAVVGQSKAYLLATEKNNIYTGEPLWKDFWQPGSPGVEPEYEFLQGYFKKIGGNFVFCDMNGNQKNIKFTLNNNAEFASLRLIARMSDAHRTKFAFTGSEAASNPNSNFMALYDSQYYNTTGNHRLADVISLGRTIGNVGFAVENMEAVVTDYAGLFSGTEISKEKLLSGDKSPADYLLSYCKMFGLYFYYDSAEEADNPEKYPAGVIHIMDRDTFYTDEVVDLSKMIDYSRKLTVTPATANAKWYSFSQEQVESDVNNQYRELFGTDYGQQLVNTNYNFDSNTTELYDGNAFRAGVMARKKDKYFKKPNQQGIPNCIYNGFSYELFASDGTGYNSKELDMVIRTTNDWDDLNDLNLPYFDCFPKLVCHTEDNAASDGSGVLLFLNHTVETRGEGGNINYWLTDDIPDMIYLNDAEPCYILTNSETDAAGNRIAYRMNYLPYFTRDKVLFGQEGFMAHSWNFGHPRVTFVPNTYTTEGDSIYDIWWKDYIGDMYDENTRKLNCYVKAEFDGKPWPYWLRRFYWFDNSLWRLNEIKDLNMSSFDVTQMEFIKVQSQNNYKIADINEQGSFEIALDNYEIGCSGGTINGMVTIQSGGGWFSGDYIAAEDQQGNRYYYESTDIITPGSARGYQTTFTLNIPAWTGATDLTWEIRLEDDFDQGYTVQLVQHTCNPTSYLRLVPQEQYLGQSSTVATFTVESLNVSNIHIHTWNGGSNYVNSVTLNNNVLTVTFNQTVIANPFHQVEVNVRGDGLNGELQTWGIVKRTGGSIDIKIPSQPMLLDYWSDTLDGFYMFDDFGFFIDTDTAMDWTAYIN